MLSRGFELVGLDVSMSHDWGFRDDKGHLLKRTPLRRSTQRLTWRNQTQYYKVAYFMGYFSDAA